MATLFQRHCNDESLISHLDGELPFYRRARVRRHLEECWQCRLRLSEIETQVLGVTRAMERDAFPGPQRIADARLKFLSRADVIASEVFDTRRPRAVRVWGLAWAGACLVLLGAFLAWKASRTPPAPAAVDVIQRLEKAETQAARLPARQRFRVVARQLRPQPASRESRLELWSEPERGRYMTRFSDGRGVLRHAVWQPEPGRQYVYRAATVLRLSRQQAQERWDQIFIRDGLTLEDLEAGLLTWLEDRSWRPVSFSSGVAHLASADGGALSAEEVRPDTLRLRARKSAGLVTVEFVLDVNARTYTPSLQLIRYQSPARTLELELHSEPADTTTAVSFEPPPSLLKPPTRTPIATVIPAVDPSVLEVEIFQALHRVRACLGETIDVHPKPGGSFEVRGAVVSPERKEQVLAALASLAGPRLAVDLKSADEILREIGPESVSPNLPPPTGTVRRPFPGNETHAGELADRILSAGESVMTDAQALRTLAERFGALESVKARRLVEAIAYDHLHDLEGKVEAARGLLRPVLGAPAVPPPEVSPAGQRWDAELLRIFDLAKTWNEGLRALSSGGSGAAAAQSLPQLESAIRAAARKIE